MHHQFLVIHYSTIIFTNSNRFLKMIKEKEILNIQSEEINTINMFV
jgi:hypothetical protein